LRSYKPRIPNIPIKATSAAEVADQRTSPQGRQLMTGAGDEAVIHYQLDPVLAIIRA
jgi:hypothetical protein